MTQDRKTRVRAGFYANDFFKYERLSIRKR